MSTPVPTTNSSSAAILNNAYSISQTAGRPVAYSDRYNGKCARGASAVAASMTNSPALFNTVAANAWDSRSKYQEAKDPSGQPLYNANQDYPPGGVTSADLANVPPGTVVTFNYPDSKTGNYYGHAMTFMGNDPTTGQPQWASDNVNDSPDKFLNKGNLEGISVVTPTAAGQQAISQQCGNLATGQQANYTLPPSNGDANGVASSGQSFSTGGSTGVADPSLTPDQAISLNDQFFNSLGPGASAPQEPLQALQSKAQNPYSNKQLIAPVSITLNVEGTFIDADLLLKQMITNSHDTTKQNSVLAIKRIDTSTTSAHKTSNATRKKQLSLANGKVPVNNNPSTPAAPAATGGGGAPSAAAGGAPNIASAAAGVADIPNAFLNQHNLAQSVFNSGAQAITQSLAGRVPDVGALLSGNASLAGALQTINTIPGLSQALNNPLGALTQTAGLDLQHGLPSASLGSLQSAFGIASGIASSGIPTSITGAVDLALQVKAVVCNLQIPNITVPPIQQLLKLNLTAVEKQIQDLVIHEAIGLLDEVLDPFKKILDQIQNFFDPQNIQKLLAGIIPDVNDLLRSTFKEFTSCNDGPGAKKNDLSGKDPTSDAPPAADSNPVNPPADPPQTSPATPTTSSDITNNNSGSNATSFLNSAPASSSGPTYSNETETNYDAKGNIISSTGPGTTPAPAAIQPTPPSTPSTASVPNQNSRTPVWSAASQAQINALNSGQLK